MRYSRLGRRRLGVIVVMMLLVSLLTPLTALAAPAQSNGGNTQWVQVYTVQRGDTLSGIAASFGVSSEALMEANSIRNPNQIYVGQQLIIPDDDEYGQGKGGPECGSYYTVRRGDTLSEIALYKNVDQDYLAHVNAISNDNDIYVGQTLCIPSWQGNNSYPQQPQQRPQQPQRYPQKNQNQGCDSCGQSQNNGPQRPQHPDNDEYDSPHNDSYNDGDHQGGQGCDSCSQQQNNGPRNDGNYNDGGHQGNQQCDSCGQPQNNGPRKDGPQNNGQGCGDPCGQQNNGPQNNGQGCDPCGQQQGNGPRNEGDRHDGPQLQPTDSWKGDYYNDKYFSKFFTERQDLDVNFNWGTGAPIEGMNKDRFSVRWERVANFKGGPTRFYVTADDGVRVYVDDKLIIDHWVIQPATDFTADVNLRPGPYKVVVEYYEEAEDAVIRVRWEQIDHHDYDDDDYEYDHDGHH